MSDSSPGGRGPDRLVRLAFGAGALLSVVAGLMLYLFAGSLGFDEDTAELIAIAFLLVGVGDYAVLHFWDRIFN